MENTFEPSVSNLIHLVGVCIEIFGVFIILAGIVWSTLLFAQQRNVERFYDQYKIRIGRSLLLGLEVLVACCRHSENHSDRIDLHEPRASRWASGGANLPELDLGA